jgi:hypothetical protein
VTEPATDPELRRQLADAIAALGKAETELAALRAVARGYCPQCGRGDAAPTIEDWERERDERGRLEIANRALNNAAREAMERAERAEAAHAQTIDSMEAVVRRARRAEATIARIRALHTRTTVQTTSGPQAACSGCEADSMSAPWPCDTIAALDQPALAEATQTTDHQEQPRV